MTNPVNYGIGVKAAFVIAGLLFCIVGGIGSGALKSLGSHREEVGHPGTIAILERIEDRLERIEDALIEKGRTY